MNYKYTYDPASNITQKATEQGTYEYQYDDLYRLTTVSNPWGMSNEAWSYDALGNRKTDKQRGGSNPWQVNANSLIEHQTTDPAPELNQSYQYDAQNRLIEVRAKDGQRIASYQYDPFGRRIAKTTGEGTTYFLYTDDGLIAEASANGTITTEYGWKPGSPWSTPAEHHDDQNRRPRQRKLRLPERSSGHPAEDHRSPGASRLGSPSPGLWGNEGANPFNDHQ